MAQRQLCRLGNEFACYADKLIAVVITTVGQFIETSPLQISLILDLSVREAKQLLNKISYEILEQIYITTMKPLLYVELDTFESFHYK